MAEEHRKYADFDELVFEHRNKAYGAYDLRKSYSKDLTKAFFIGVGLFSAAIILPFIYTTAIAGSETEEYREVEVVLDDVTLPEEKPEEEKPEEIIEKVEEEVQVLKELAPPSDVPPVATIQNIVPEPKQDAKNETPPPTKEEMQDKAIATKTQEGEKATNNAPPPVKGVEGGQGTKEVKPDVPIVKEDPKIIHNTADKEPEFPNGGIEGLRKMVQSNFDTEAVEGEGILTTEVVFVVEPDGNISQVKASGKNSDFNREAERVIKSIRTRWKPAEKGGQKVRYRYRFPLKMRFE